MTWRYTCSRVPTLNECKYSWVNYMYRPTHRIPCCVQTVMTLIAVKYWVTMTTKSIIKLDIVCLKLVRHFLQTGMTSCNIFNNCIRLMQTGPTRVSPGPCTTNELLQKKKRMKRQINHTNHFRTELYYHSSQWNPVYAALVNYSKLTMLQYRI